MKFGNLFARYIHPEIAGLARYAGELAGDEALPRRRLFEPMQISGILDFVYLIEFLPEENDYFFSLSGSRMGALFGADFGGHRLSEMGDTVMRESLRTSYDRVIKTRQPLYMRGYYVWPQKSVPIERLLIPMVSDEGDVNAILGISVPGVADIDLELYTGEGVAQLVGEDELMLDVG